MADPMLADRARAVTAGIDTHKDFHVVAVIDTVGADVADASFENTAGGHDALARWLTGHGPVGLVGVEGCGSWGAGLARYLTAAGFTVVEINRPNRAERRSRGGKTDTIDAYAAARTAAAGRDAGTPKSGTGPIEAIRFLHDARRLAVGTRTRVINQLKATVDTAPTELTDPLRRLSTPKLITACLEFETPNTPDTPRDAATWTLQHLATTHRALNDDIARLDTELTRLVTNTAPTLTACFGVATHTAAILLIAAGDNPHRLTNSAAFAALCGASPIPASSGRTTRHRLNPGGNRQANHALWRIAMVRLAHHEPTRIYATRRRTEGLSTPEIIRCLKRYIAREIHRALLADLTHHP